MPRTLGVRCGQTPHRSQTRDHHETMVALLWEDSTIQITNHSGLSPASRHRGPGVSLRWRSVTDGPFISCGRKQCPQVGGYIMGVRAGSVRRDRRRKSTHSRPGLCIKQPRRPLGHSRHRTRASAGHRERPNAAGTWIFRGCLPVD
jgi:hypothetical protein